MKASIGTEAARRRATGQRIREWRQRRALSQSTVARAADITQASLSNYETGKRDLPLATLLNLAAALDVPVGDLISTPDVIVVRDSRLGSAVHTLTRRPDLVSAVTGNEATAAAAS
ncbi:MAG: helix-turn-helix domain-containing protein [Chloroflexi bacterium]|nr:helix-turn-helix domain-containing protein [Chloroflexota bacterium]